MDWKTIITSVITSLIIGILAFVLSSTRAITLAGLESLGVMTETSSRGRFGGIFIAPAGGRAGKGNSFMAGAPAGCPAGFEQKEIAKLLEYGTSDGPAVLLVCVRQLQP